MTEFDLGKVVGEDGEDGNSIWTTSTAPTTPNYTFTITNLTGPSGTTPRAGDIIIYNYYWYQISTVGETTVQATTQTSIRGATGPQGQNGTNGVGISSITKTGTSGKTDTYTITYTNGTTSTYTVTNGDDATVTIVTSFGSTTSDSKVPSEKLVKTELDKKIATSSTAGLIKNDGTVDTTSYSTFSGSYNDLSNKPSIPSSSSDLSDGTSLVKTSSTTGLLKNDGSVMSSGTGASNWAVGNHTHSGYVSATKVTSWSSTVSDSNVPSEKLVKDTLDDIEDLIGDAITYINQ